MKLDFLWRMSLDDFWHHQLNDAWRMVPKADSEQE
jgi:hypothetical protein